MFWNLEFKSIKSNDSEKTFGIFYVRLQLKIVNKHLQFEPSPLGIKIPHRQNRLVNSFVYRNVN